MVPNVPLFNRERAYLTLTWGSETAVRLRSGHDPGQHVSVSPARKVSSARFGLFNVTLDAFHQVVEKEGRQGVVHIARWWSPHSGRILNVRP